MPTVTVQGGGSTVLSLQYTAVDVVAAANQLARQITNAVRSSSMPLTFYQGATPASGVLAVSSVGNDIALTSGNQYVIVNAGPAGNGAPMANTIHGATNTAGLELLADNGGLTYWGAANSSGTVLAGDGGNLLATASTGGGGYTFVSGAGNDTILAVTGNNTVAAGTGHNTIFLGSATNVVYAVGQDTIIGGAGSDASSRGSDLISVIGFASVLVWAANTDMNLVNGSASSTVFGGYGSETIDAGVGGGFFVAGGGGHSHLSAGGGYAQLWGTADGDVLTATGDQSHLLGAGAGNETLNGANSTGVNTYVVAGGNTVVHGGSGTDFMFAGTGHATLEGGLGGDFYCFQNGKAGVNTVVGFSPLRGDVIFLGGFNQAAERDHAVATQVSNGTSTTLTLSDNTKITFLGVSSISGQSFYIG